MPEETDYLEVFRAVKNNQPNRADELLREQPKLAAAVLPTGQTLLHAAVFYGHAELVPLLVKHGVALNQGDNRSGETPLHLAVRENHRDAAEALLTAGADVKVGNNVGWTPLHDAAHDGNLQMIDLLLSFNAEINAKDQGGSTPTGVALVRQQVGAADRLRSRGGESHVFG